MSSETLQGRNAVIVIPSDTSDIDFGGLIPTSLVTGGVLYIGTGGDLKVTMLGGQTVTFTNVPNGAFMPIQVTKVWDTGTNADNIIALF
jgi:hypothetical protein